MSNHKKNKNIIFFANTLWFLWNFKLPLAKKLNDKGYNVKFIYLNTGYFSTEKEEKKAKFILNKSNIYVSKIWDFKAHKRKSNILLVYTIKSIILSPIFFLNCKIKIANYEGLGRVFSSRLIVDRVIRRLIEKIYYVLHRTYYNHAVVLNSFDYIHFLDKNISTPKNISILPGTGIDLEKFKFNPKYEINLKTQYVTMISRYNIQKGINTYLALVYLSNTYLNRLIGHKLNFKLVMPTEDSIKMRSLIKDNEILNQNLLITNYSLDANKVYEDSLCIVHPTQYGEGLPRIFLEASSCGVPVITTRGRGATDFYDDKVNVLFVEPNNPKQILNSIKFLIDNDQLRCSLIHNAKSDLERIHEYIKPEELYIKILQKLIIN